MEALKIIALFGGIRPMAKALGHENPTTVASWAKKESIPYWRSHEILTAARKLRLGLKETDLAGGK